MSKREKRPFIEKLLFPSYVREGTTKEKAKGIVGWTNPITRLIARLQWALRDAYLSAFSIRGANNEAFVNAFTRANLRDKVKVLFGLEKHLFKETANVANEKSGPFKRFGRRVALVAKFIGFALFTLANLIFIATRLAVEFLPKLISNIFFAFSFFFFERLMSKKNENNNWFLNGIGLLVCGALYAVFRAIWVVGRAFASPFESFRRAVQTPQTFFGKGVRGIIGGLILGALSLALSTALYVVFFPLFLKYVVLKGLAQIHRLTDIAQKVMSFLSQAAHHAFSIKEVSWLGKIGSFLNHVIPSFSSIQALVGIGSEVSAIMSGAVVPAVALVVGGSTVFDVCCKMNPRASNKKQANPEQRDGELVVDEIKKNAEDNKNTEIPREAAGEKFGFFKTLQKHFSPEAGERAPDASMRRRQRMQLEEAMKEGYSDFEEEKSSNAGASPEFD